VFVSSVCRIAFLALLRGCHLPSTDAGDIPPDVADDGDTAFVFLDGDDNGDEAEDFFALLRCIALIV